MYGRRSVTYGHETIGFLSIFISGCSKVIRGVIARRVGESGNEANILALQCLIDYLVPRPFPVRAKVALRAQLRNIP